MPLNTTFLSSECFVLSLLVFFAVVCICFTYVTQLIMKEGNTDNFAVTHLYSDSWIRVNCDKEILTYVDSFYECIVCNSASIIK